MSASFTVSGSKGRSSAATVGVVSRGCVIVLVALAGITVGGGQLRAATGAWGDATGLTSNQQNVPQNFTWYSGQSITLNRTTSMPSTLYFENLSYTFPATNPVNPEWAQGTHKPFVIYHDYTSGSISESVTMNWQFTSPLGPGVQLVFGDFDGYERALVRAYDTNDDLIPFSAFAVTVAPGNETGTIPPDFYSFTSNATYSFDLQNTDGKASNNVLLGVTSSTTIKSLSYELTMNYGGILTHNSRMFVDFAAVIPEPATAGLLVLAGFALLRGFRRRQ